MLLVKTAAFALMANAIVNLTTTAKLALTTASMALTLQLQEPVHVSMDTKETIVQSLCVILG